MVSTWSNQVLNMKVKPHGIYPILYALGPEAVAVLDAVRSRFGHVPNQSRRRTNVLTLAKG